MVTLPQAAAAIIIVAGALFISKSLAKREGDPSTGLGGMPDGSAIPAPNVVPFQIGAPPSLEAALDYERTDYGAELRAAGGATAMSIIGRLI